MARLLDQVLGHQETISRFLLSMESGKLPHTFLFVGPSGVGRKTVALALAQALTCEKNKSACGVCGSCLRIEKAIKAKTWQTESLLLIEPEKNLIKIEQAHQILNFLSLRSLNPQRVVIIDSADSLNPQAANSLLKALEEPPVGTFFFMIAQSSAHVLPTLRSRAQVVAFQPLSVDEMREKTQAPNWALKASQGSFERLDQLLQKEELEIRESALSWLQDWIETPMAYLKPEHREIVRDREAAKSLAAHLSWLFRDALYLKIGAESKVLNSDKVSVLKRLMEKVPQDVLFRSCEKAIWIEQKLNQNQDSSLVFEQFWIETSPQNVVT
jgi:DNA polymerase III subunit delta'